MRAGRYGASSISDGGGTAGVAIGAAVGGAPAAEEEPVGVGGGGAPVSRRNGLRKARLVVVGGIAPWPDIDCPGAGWEGVAWEGAAWEGIVWVGMLLPDNCALDVLCSVAWPGTMVGPAEICGARRCWADPQYTQISHSLRTRLPHAGQLCCSWLWQLGQ